MENKLLIRKGKIEDLNSLINLRKEHFKYEIDMLGNELLDSNWLVSDDCRDDFKYFILDENAVIFVAEIDDIIVGYICGELAYKKEWYKENVATLTNIYIKENFRRKNIGKYLLEYFKEFVKENGYLKIEVTTIINNDIAIDFYEKNDFKKTSVQLMLDIN